MKSYNSILLFAFSVFLFGFGINAQAQKVTRGPYLQVGTPNSVIVKWRTDTAVSGQVRYGSSPGNLSSAANGSGSTTKHEVLVSGLSADTKYYYSVGTNSTTLAGGDGKHYFMTSPAPGTAKPTRVWLLGDSGTKNSNARAVRDAYYNDTGDRHTDLWLMLGDNAYAKGSDDEYQEAVFENMYESMLIKSVLWPTLGNHDNKTSATPGPYPYYEIFTLPKNGEAGGLASGTEEYYSFDYGNIHFICLNSAENRLIKTDSPMWTWLQEDLAANDKDWTIAFWHHPPYSKGSHNSDSEGQLEKMRKIALPILEESGVDLVFSGHSHSYERSFLLDGHYGASSTFTKKMKIDGGNGQEDGDGAYRKATLGSGPHEGAVYTVAGSSGKTSGGKLNHPAMAVSLRELGSVSLDIDGNRLDAKFIDDQGNVRDYFSIIKGSENTGPASQLVMSSGNNQTGLVGATLPNSFVVRVLDANNNPVSGIAVTFEIASGSGSLSNSQPQITGGNGKASTVLTFGSASGEVTVKATALGLSGSPQIFTATAIENDQDTTSPAPPQNVRAESGSGGNPPR